MKQLTIEVWSKNGNLKKIRMFHWEGIALFNVDKEYEERESIRKNGDIWRVHWRHVANNPQTVNFEEPVKLTYQQRRAKIKAEKKAKLIAEKMERIERYRQQVEKTEALIASGGEKVTDYKFLDSCGIQPTAEDINSAMNLQDLIGRQKKVLPNNVLATMSEFVEQPDEVCGIEHLPEWEPARNNDEFVEYAENGGVMFHK